LPSDEDLDSYRDRLGGSLQKKTLLHWERLGWGKWVVKTDGKKRGIGKTWRTPGNYSKANLKVQGGSGFVVTPQESG